MTDTGRQPLAGRKVVITRSAEQADDLATLVRATGATPVVVPLVTIESVQSEADRLGLLDMTEFEWLMVTSPNGARSFGLSGCSAPPNVGAVGTATAAVLAEFGIAATLVPTRQNAEGMLAELPAEMNGAVLLVQAEAAEPTLAAGLRERGCAVTVVMPYRTVPVRPAAAHQLAALSADAVLFASGSAARAWFTVFGSTTPALVVSIGPRTSAAIDALGLKVNLEATDHSLSGLVDVLVDHLGNVL